ncbi:MAG: hypothetical protein ABJ092_15885 [Gillisia sp.]
MQPIFAVATTVEKYTNHSWCHKLNPFFNPSISSSLEACGSNIC